MTRSSLSYKRHRGIEARIEYLGQLNERRLRANESRDIIELEKIAQAYELLKRPCSTMAREIRIAISLMKDKPNHDLHSPEKSEAVPFYLDEDPAPGPTDRNDNDNQRSNEPTL